MLSISFVYLAKTFSTLKQLYPFFNNKWNRESPTLVYHNKIRKVPAGLYFDTVIKNCRVD